MPLGRKRNEPEPPAQPSEPSERPVDPAQPSESPADRRPGSSPTRAEAEQPRTMLPARSKRSAAEAAFMRLIATAGIVGICVAIAAIMGSSDVQGWIIGLVVSLISVVLAGLLWSSRRL